MNPPLEQPAVAEVDRFRLLLVEDNPGDVRYIEELLDEAMARSSPFGGNDRSDLQVVHETRVSEAVERLAGGAFDALLLDLNLPDSGGLDTLDAIRERTTDLPIVVLTGLDDREIGVRAIRRGAQEYLAKDELTEDLLTRSLRHAIERKRRERQLAALNALSRRLSEAEGPAAIGEAVVGTARSMLDLPIAALALYDSATGDLRLASQSPAAETVLPGGLLDDYSEGGVWQAFIDQEVRVVTDPDAERADGAEPSLSNLLVVPMDRQGVLLLGSDAADGPTNTEVELAKMLAGNTRAALDRAAREEELHEREEELRAQNTALERLNRINSIIREIAQTVIRATTREGIERAVCDRLADADPYLFAWIGEVDPVEGTVEPRVRAGSEDGYLDDVTVDVGDDSAETGPIVRAVRTREPATGNIVSDPAFEPWRREALARGYRSNVAIPIEYGENLYGVLTVYAGQPDVFTEMEQAVLAELGDTVAHAINALERKRALIGEGVVELEFRVRDEGLVPLELAEETGGRIELETLVPRTDGSIVAYVSVRDAPPDRIVELASATTAIDGIDHVASSEEEDTFECRLTGSSFVSALLDHGAVPRTLVAHDGVGTVVVELPKGADVRSFVEVLRERYPETELVTRRDVDQPRRTRRDFQAAFEERLTDRQLEVLRTAYFRGYFEWPRERTGQEIADLLDVSQPTVNRHLRAAQRTVFGMLLDR